MTAVVYRNRPEHFRITPDEHWLKRGAVLLGLGRTHNTTRYHDSSARKNHGTLTNMDPATDWVWSNTLNRFALDFDGSNDCVVNATPVFATTFPFSIAFWTKIRVAYRSKQYGQTYLVQCSRYDGAETSLFSLATDYQSLADKLYYYANGLVRVSTNTFTVDTWQHFAISFDSSTVVRLWINGVQSAITQPSAAMSIGSARIYLGALDGTGLFCPCTLSDVIAYRGMCQTPMVQQLADPSNVMLSGLILPPRRKLWAVAGIAPVELVVGDAECVVTADTVALTQHHVMVVGGCESVVTSEQPTFTQHQVLVVADSECTVESEQPAFTQHQVLVVGDAECVVESELPTFTQHQVIAVEDAECVVASEQPVLTQHHVLTVGDAESVVTSDTVTLVHHPVGALVVADSECGVTSDTVALTQHQVLTVADAECLVESGEVTLTAHNEVSLIVANSECGVTSGLVVLTQHQLLQVLDAECVVTSETVTLGSGLVGDGLDYAARDNRPHYSVIDNRPHFRVF